MCISAKILLPSFRWLPPLYNSGAEVSRGSCPSAPLSLCARKNILLRSLFWFFFGVQKRTKPCYRSRITSDEKIFRVLTGSCCGGIMESRRGEKTYSIYPPSAKPKHHRDKVQSIPAVVAEERSGTTASHRKIFS